MVISVLKNEPVVMLDYSKMIITMAAHPWPHLIVDNFLSDAAFELAMAEVRSEGYDFEIEQRGTGRIEFAVLTSETLWRSIYSSKAIALINAAFDVDVKLNRHNLLQLRRMNEETPDFPIHSDFTEGDEVIASFLYLNSPGNASGGKFNLFGSKKESSPAASIEPEQNRFLAFRTKPAHWHSVGRVNGWERLSVLAMWDIEPKR